MLLSDNYDLQPTITSFEQALLALIPAVQVYRVDEYLLDEWGEIETSGWFRDPKKASEFVNWLRDQNPMHWKQVR